MKLLVGVFSFLDLNYFDVSGLYTGRLDDRSLNEAPFAVVWEGRLNAIHDLKAISSRFIIGLLY